MKSKEGNPQYFLVLFLTVIYSCLSLLFCSNCNLATVYVWVQDATKIMISCRQNYQPPAKHEASALGP